MTTPMAHAADVRRLVQMLRAADVPVSLRDVFLRELISNAADAIDRCWEAERKLRSPATSGDFIRVIANLSEGTLTIWDSGIGMSGDELKTNFDRVQKPGGRKLLDAMVPDASALAQAQFGLGFFSSFLVAHQVRVVSKKATDAQYVLDTDGASFRVQLDESPAPALERGTQVILHLTELGQKFLDHAVLCDLIRTQCDFVLIPIFMPAALVCEPVVSSWLPAAPSSETVLTPYYQRINVQVPLWMRPPSTVKPEEYAEFYCRHFKQWQAPLAYERVESDLEIAFSGALFMPHHDDLDVGVPAQPGVRLFIRHVLVPPEHCAQVLPRFLGFLKAVVWVDESFAELAKDDFKGLKALTPALTEAALNMLIRLALRDPERFNLAFSAFGWTLCMGLQDRHYRHLVVGLLRFYSSKSPDHLTSLEEYVDRMQPRQQDIFYVSGATRTAVLGSPALKAAADCEVLLAVPPLDDGVMHELAGALPEAYPHFRLHSLGKERARYETGSLKQAAREAEEPLSTT